jgi:hypothetical protein
MIVKVVLPLLFACLLCSEVHGQNKKKSKGPTSINSSAPSTEVYAPKTSKKKKSSETTYDARDKYYDRVEQLGKTRRKSEKLSSNPQYTNFQYFGHKKPPKKRPPEKMKFCKICGIRH